jgi:hypothetical protein
VGAPRACVVLARPAGAGKHHGRLRGPCLPLNVWVSARVAAWGAGELMGAVLSLVAHEFRARWRSWVLLVILVAVAGGAVLAAAAGARRTDSAYQRFLYVSKASDVLVSPSNTGLDGYYRALARLPDVAALVLQRHLGE